MNIPWTSAEETQIILFYRFMDVTQLSEHINRSALAISFRVLKLGLETSLYNVRGFKRNWLNNIEPPAKRQKQV
jgi:hypothetical protein